MLSEGRSRRPLDGASHRYLSSSPSAAKTAGDYRHGRIVLIDGIKLTELMLAYGVGVQKAREFTLYEMDEDFFSDELGEAPNP
ncbi:hypothetical protein V3M68_05265 [Trueperella pyogenes]|uniref:hypothetical protein n=1 Tax=Trueperella pyogenes TaxID=1661 RepID=UPI000ABFB7D2|nr:hypothetical protein [Trueperella pyogenes]AZR01624.1 hypothetical protein EB776_10155 [Trueperella pyogenes]